MPLAIRARLLFADMPEQTTHPPIFDDDDEIPKQLDAVHTCRCGLLDAAILT